MQSVVLLVKQNARGLVATRLIAFEQTDLPIVKIPATGQGIVATFAGRRGKRGG